MLTGGSRILEIDVYDRHMKPLVVNYTEEPIFFSLYRTFRKRGNTSGSGINFFPFTNSAPSIFSGENNVLN